MRGFVRPGPNSGASCVLIDEHAGLAAKAVSWHLGLLQGGPVKRVQPIPVHEEQMYPKLP